MRGAVYHDARALRMRVRTLKAVIRHGISDMKGRERAQKSNCADVFEGTLWRVLVPRANIVDVCNDDGAAPLAANEHARFFFTPGAEPEMDGPHY